MTSFDEQFALFRQDIDHHPVKSKEKQYWEVGLAPEDSIFKLQAAFNNRQEAEQAIDRLLNEHSQKFSRGEDYDSESRLVYARLKP